MSGTGRAMTVSGWRPPASVRRGRGGFTLLEVMIAMTIFTIAFVGMMMMMAVMIQENVDTESEMRVMERGRKAIEEIRALADSQYVPVGSQERPGIMAVLNHYSQPKYATFDLQLPSIDSRAEFSVVLYTNENAIPAFLTRLGDYNIIADNELTDLDRALIPFDINADGRFDNILPPRYNKIRTLPVEVGVTWRDRHGSERFMQFTTLINR